MKRIGIVGLSLFAAFAFSAMVASTAMAGLYITCVKVAKVNKKYTGMYTDAACSKLSATSEGKYEVGKPTFPILVTSKSKSAVLSSGLGDITAKASTGMGEILSATLNLEETKFSTVVLGATKGKCTDLSEYEKTGKYNGIVTSYSMTQLLDAGEVGGGGKELAGSAPGAGEVWNDFTPDEGSPVYPYQAVYICEPGVIFRTSGSTASQVQKVLTKPSTKGEQIFSASVGEQALYTEYSENGGVTFESTGMNVETVTGDTTTATAIEVTDQP
jgi:hypothetical protein